MLDERLPLFLIIDFRLAPRNNAVQSEQDRRRSFSIAQITQLAVGELLHVPPVRFFSPRISFTGRHDSRRAHPSVSGSVVRCGSLRGKSNGPCFFRFPPSRAQVGIFQFNKLRRRTVSGCPDGGQHPIWFLAMRPNSGTRPRTVGRWVRESFL